MTTATASPSPSTAHAASGNPIAAWLGKHHFALRRLHSLSGLAFGGYVVVHLLVNATLIEGLRYGTEDIYQTQVNKIHELPFLLAVEWSLILLPILFHTAYGVLIVAAGRPNVGRYGSGMNWAYTVQRITAVVLVFFIAFHYLTMKGAFGGTLGSALTFVPHEATQTTVNHMHAAWWVGWVVYPLGILAATFHLANGFWTAGVTWGVTVSARSQRLWMFACIGLFLFTLGCGFVSLGAALRQQPTDGPTPAQRGIESRVGEKEGAGMEAVAPGAQNFER